MLPFKQKLNGIFLKNTAAATIFLILYLSHASFGYITSRELTSRINFRDVRSRDRDNTEYGDRRSFERTIDSEARRNVMETSTNNPYIRDVRADSRQSRIDARDIRTDFREIRTELRDINNNDRGSTENPRDRRDTTRVDNDRENRQQIIQQSRLSQDSRRDTRLQDSGRETRANGVDGKQINDRRPTRTVNDHEDRQERTRQSEDERQNSRLHDTRQETRGVSTRESREMRTSERRVRSRIQEHRAELRLPQDSGRDTRLEESRLTRITNDHDRSQQRIAGSRLDSRLQNSIRKDSNLSLSTRRETRVNIRDNMQHGRLDSKLQGYKREARLSFKSPRETRAEINQDSRLDTRLQEDRRETRLSFNTPQETRAVRNRESRQYERTESRLREDRRESRLSVNSPQETRAVRNRESRQYERTESRLQDDRRESRISFDSPQETRAVINSENRLETIQVFRVKPRLTDMRENQRRDTRRETRATNERDIISPGSRIQGSRQKSRLPIFEGSIAESRVQDITRESRPNSAINRERISDSQRETINIRQNLRGSRIQDSRQKSRLSILKERIAESRDQDITRASRPNSANNREVISDSQRQTINIRQNSPGSRIQDTRQQSRLPQDTRVKTDLINVRESIIVDSRTNQIRHARRDSRSNNRESRLEGSRLSNRLIRQEQLQDSRVSRGDLRLPQDFSQQDSRLEAREDRIQGTRRVGDRDTRTNEKLMERENRFPFERKNELFLTARLPKINLEGRERRRNIENGFVDRVDGGNEVIRVQKRDRVVRDVLREIDNSRREPVMREERKKGSSDRTFENNFDDRRSGKQINENERKVVERLQGFDRTTEFVPKIHTNSIFLNTAQVFLATFLIGQILVNSEKSKFRFLNLLGPFSTLKEKVQ